MTKTAFQTAAIKILKARGYVVNVGHNYFRAGLFTNENRDSAYLHILVRIYAGYATVENHVAQESLGRFTLLELLEVPEHEELRAA
jgi:hypothetical protein